MAPIEYFFAIIAGIIFVVTMIRGYARELGNTLVFLVAIFIFSMAETYLDQILGVARGRFPSIPPENSVGLQQILALGFMGALTMIIFASYAGRTFQYGGKQAPPPQGTLLNFGIGLLNGYLIAGTYWYFLHKFNYPFADVSGPVTSTANGLIPLLPLNLFDSPFIWMLPVALLILLRIRG